MRRLRYFLTGHQTTCPVSRQFRKPLARLVCWARLHRWCLLCLQDTTKCSPWCPFSPVHARYLQERIDGMKEEKRIARVNQFFIDYWGPWFRRYDRRWEEIRFRGLKETP